ncbi:MAG: FAD-dependent oxidoreductase [Chitinophagaceae bacterium]|nr:MAG: FAD-dependent oxidoreductase [Chitinophagaceae bacterium]
MKHIAIIGAGISGLVTAKIFLQAGHKVTVFEKANDLGGVWEKSRSYLGVATQTTRDEYAFSDFPMPADYPDWPSGSQVQKYLSDYARRFEVLPRIRFRTGVNQISRHSKGWNLYFTDLSTYNDDHAYFDFVAVCTGTFHKPHVPYFPGQDSFIEAGGQILHSSQVKDKALLSSGRVAVLGFAKSATDIATIAAGVSKECTLIYRKAQWKVPRYFGNKVNMRYLLFSRLSEAFFDAPRKSVGKKLLHTLGKPLVWAQWRGLEMLLKKQFRLKKCDMVPSHRIEDQISCSLGVAPVGFYEHVHSGRIVAKRAEILRMEGKNILLSNGDTVTADVLVCGTGFRQELPFLDVHLQQLVKSSNGYQLYRNIVHPAIPALGFVGFNSSLFSTLTSEIAAHWLLNYLDGTLDLPSKEEMVREVEYMTAWRNNSRPVSSEFSGTCVAPFNFLHIDTLMKDMGLRRKLSRSPMEYLKPINPADYRQLLLDGRIKFTGQTSMARKNAHINA